MRKELLVYGSPAIENAEIEEVVTVMQSGWLGTGPRVARFEMDFAEYKGTDMRLRSTLVPQLYTLASWLQVLGLETWWR